ncbi:MAG: hypothetical protein HY914_16290 [Desulfomonile tiedjei]|nr:hypothetical protein [Desulfomonile tiedjei]
MLRIRIRDVRRATLPIRSGNEGWIGIAPAGDQYHLVVPVDTQIARGVMACNRPTDGTPFGGYTGWLYFRCSPYEDEGSDEEALREKQVRQTCEQLLRFAASYGIEAELDADDAPPDPSHDESQPVPALHAAQLVCPACGKDWENVGAFTRDVEVEFKAYRACVDDFRRGVYRFRHRCGALVEVPVWRFARPRVGEKSLIGSHACPGFCFYETSLDACSARCEGACYRRIAEKLKSKAGG